jgi:TonB C terminal
MVVFRFLLCCVLLWYELPAAADDAGAGGAPAATRSFDIHAQSLDAALAQFAIQSGLHVLYDSAAAAHRDAAGVRGVLTMRAALAQLLAGTDLVAQFTSHDSVTLVHEGEDQAVIPLGTLSVVAAMTIGQPRSWESYARTLQSAILAAFKNQDELQHRDYRATLHVWVESNGRIGRVEIPEASGDTLLDETMPARLQAIVVPAPPPGMPQPVQLRISVRKLQDARAP